MYHGAQQIYNIHFMANIINVSCKQNENPFTLKKQKNKNKFVYKTLQLNL